MKKFDSSKWITENKHGSSFNNELITIFTEVFIQSSLPKGILKENLSLQLEAKISDVIKDKVNKLPSNVKDEFKEFQQSLQGDGVKLIDFLKTAAATFKGVDKKEIPALLASLELKEGITEAKVEGVDSIEALSSLQPTNSFTWNQETTELPSDNYSVFGNSDNSQSLIKGQSYTLSPRTKTGDINDTDIRGILLQNNAAREKTSKFKGFIQKIKGKAKTNAVIALTLLTLMVPQMFGDSLNVAQDEFKDAPIENIVAQETGINLDNTLDLGDKLSGGGGGTDIVKVLDIAGGDNPSEAGVQGDFNNDKNSIVTGGKFKTGEYELSESEKDAYINQAFGALASLMDAQIGDSDTKKLTVNSNIILDYSGYISNSGEDANKPNDGTADLQKGRENTALEIATAVKTKIDQYQIDNYGKIIIKVELNKIDNSGFENQDSQETSDYLATQGFKVKTNVNLDFDESGESIELVQNNFEYAEYDVAGGGSPTGKKVGGEIDGPIRKDDEEEKEDNEVIIDPPKDEEEIMKATRRNDQWAFILQKLKPATRGNEMDSLDIYAMVEADQDLQNLLASDLSTQDIGFKNKVGTGGDQVVDEEGYISNRALEISAKEATDQETRDLASLILFLRRNPDYLLDKINSFYSEDKQPLNKRAKSKSTFGKFTKGGIVSTAEISLKEMLGYNSLLNENEALWGKMVSDDLIKQNLEWLIPVAASIWAGKGSTNDNVLDLINRDNVSPQIQDKINKMFPSTGKAGDNYDFLPDVDRIAQYIDKNTQNIKIALDQVNTNQEFDQFMVSIVNRFDSEYISRSEILGFFTNIANKLPKDVNEVGGYTTTTTTDKSMEKIKAATDIQRIEKLLNVPALKTLLDKINNKNEFQQVVTYFINSINGLSNSVKKSRLISVSNELRSQQQEPNFQDKVKDIEPDEPVYTLTKETFKSLAEQLGYIK